MKDILRFKSKVISTITSVLKSFSEFRHIKFLIRFNCPILCNILLKAVIAITEIKRHRGICKIIILTNLRLRDIKFNHVAGYKLVKNSRVSRIRNGWETPTLIFLKIKECLSRRKVLWREFLSCLKLNLKLLGSSKIIFFDMVYAKKHIKNS
jgi:hypothetical protein